jgi:hypothetical protein
MKMTRVNINTVCNSIYDVIKLRTKYSAASEEKISHTRIILFNI